MNHFLPLLILEMSHTHNAKCVFRWLQCNIKTGWHLEWQPPLPMTLILGWEGVFKVYEDCTPSHAHTHVISLVSSLLSTPEHQTLWWKSIDRWGKLPWWMSSKSGFKTSTAVTSVSCGFATCTVKKQNIKKTSILVRPNVALDGGGGNYASEN